MESKYEENTMWKDVEIGLWNWGKKIKDEIIM